MTTYVRRDSAGRVIALSTEPLPDFVEADPRSREIEDFLRGDSAHLQTLVNPTTAP
jgi:hypothetical protein